MPTGRFAGFGLTGASPRISTALFPRDPFHDGADGFRGVAEGARDTPAPADAPSRKITRRKWLMRRIQYPIAAHFLRISRILRVNLPGWAAGGAAGADDADVTRPGAGPTVTPRVQSQIVASAARRRDWLTFSHV